MQYAYCLSRPLTVADAVQILGAVGFYLREKDVCRDLTDATGNNLAQGEVLSLREIALRSAYSGVRP